MRMRKLVRKREKKIGGKRNVFQQKVSLTEHGVQVLNCKLLKLLEVHNLCDGWLIMTNQNGMPSCS